MKKTDKAQSSDNQNSGQQLFDNKIVYLTSKEAADYLRTSPKQIRNWVYQGKIRFYKLLGRKLLFHKRDLDMLLQPYGGV